MNYERKYNEALSWMHEIYPTLKAADKEDAEHYFPELKESEDERIRKWILDGLDFYSDAIGAPEDHKKAIAYLERQKEYIEDIRQYAYNKGLVDAAERQQPAEWSEEDEMHLNWVIEHFRQSGELYHDLIAWLKSLRPRPRQEQPEVDLEKFAEKIKTFQGRYKYPEIVSIKGAMAFVARMFYQYPNIAKQWYEQLPKTTID